jgi:hypothetical protein
MMSRHDEVDADGEGEITLRIAVSKPNGAQVPDALEHSQKVTTPS